MFIIIFSCHWAKRAVNILVPRRGCPLFRDLTSIFIPRVFPTQAELRSQERAHVLIAIWAPFNQKITHRSRNAASPLAATADGFEAKAPTPMFSFEESYPKPVVLPPRGHLAMSELFWPPRLWRGVPLAPGGQRPGCCPSSCNARDGPTAENRLPRNPALNRPKGALPASRGV